MRGSQPQREARAARFRSKIAGAFLPRELILSAAWRSLTSTAKDVLLLFLLKRRIEYVGTGKRKSKVIGNNGEIEFSYAEAEKMGVRRSTFRLALRQLVERGFISLAEAGGLSQGREPLSAKYNVHVLDGQGQDETWMTWEALAKGESAARAIHCRYLVPGPKTSKGRVLALTKGQVQSFGAVPFQGNGTARSKK